MGLEIENEIGEGNVIYYTIIIPYRLVRFFIGTDLSEFSLLHLRYVLVQNVVIRLLNDILRNPGH